jgi:phage-related protein
VLQSSRGVIVFHAFMKKTQKTAAREIELGRKRLREVLNEGN